MSQVEELLSTAEKANQAVDHTIQDDKKWESQFRAANAAVDHLLDYTDVSDWTQDEFVRYLELVRNMSWDIPSALMGVCNHGDADDMFYMHRLSKAEREEYDKQYPDPAPSGYMGPAGPDHWEEADKHFKEVHNLDLKDARINWSFDT